MIAHLILFVLEWSAVTGAMLLATVAWSWLHVAIIGALVVCAALLRDLAAKRARRRRLDAMLILLRGGASRAGHDDGAAS